MHRLALLIGVLLLPVGEAWPQSAAPASPAEEIQGTWKLISFKGADVQSGVRGDVMGPHPSGYINYGRDGRMIVIVTGTDRKKPAASVATPDEAQALLKSLLAYAGTYTVDPKTHTVTHHIDVSWDETRTGEAHARTYRIEGDRLTLTTQPSRDPATGRQTIRTVTWERVRAP